MWVVTGGYILRSGCAEMADQPVMTYIGMLMLTRVPETAYALCTAKGNLPRRRRCRRRHPCCRNRCPCRRRPCCPCCRYHPTSTELPSAELFSSRGPVGDAPVEPLLQIFCRSIEGVIHRPDVGQRQVHPGTDEGRMMSRTRGRNEAPIRTHTAAAGGRGAGSVCGEM